MATISTVATSDTVAPNVTAAILTGGSGRRLGGVFKPGLQFGGRSILERQVKTLHAAGIHRIVCVGRAPSAGLPLLPFAADVLTGSALGGIYSALLIATTPVVLVLAGDLPLVSAPLLEALAALDDRDAIVPRLNGRWHPLCASFNRRIAPRLKKRLDAGQLRVTAALAELKVHEIGDAELRRLDAHEALLININTPDDYQHATGLIS